MFDDNAPDSGGNAAAPVAPNSAPDVGTPTSVSNAPATAPPVGNQTAQPAQPTQPPAEQPAQKPAPGSFFKALSHSFAGALIGALASPQPTQYITDDSGRTVRDPNQPPDTNKSRLQRIAQAAMSGLAAGSQVPQQKSRAASWAAGIGAGATGQMNQEQQQDAAGRAKAREDFETKQKEIMDKAIRAAHNASTYSLWQKARDEQNDHDPERAKNLAIQSAVEDYISRNPGTSMSAQVLSDKEAMAMREADAHTVGTHIFLPLGTREAKRDGQTVFEQDGVTPKTEGQLLAISGGTKDGKIPLPQAVIDDVKKYNTFVPGLKAVADLKAGFEMPLNQFLGMNKLLNEAKTKEIDGWKEKAVGENAVIKDGQKVQQNTFTGETRPYGGTPVETDLKLAQTEKDRGTITPLDRYKEQQQNYRAELAKQTAKGNEMQKAGATELQKSADKYSDFLFTANGAKSSIANAKNGDQLANSLGPLQTALLVTTANGVHRINMTEVDAAGPKVGSVARRVDAALEKAGKGQLPAETLNEMQKLVDLYVTAKYSTYLKNSAYTAKLRGLDPDTTPVFDRDGNTTTLAGALKANPQNQQPAPDTHTFDPAAWQKTHPGQDVNAAIAYAQSQGYEVKQ